jgi:mevalonate kinase
MTVSRASASAPGKVILFGEHAVVYGQPALAAPVTQVRATATVEPSGGDDIWIEARDLNRRCRLGDAGESDPLAAAVRLALEQLPDHGSWPRPGPSGPGFVVAVESTIPIASGLGSGAAVGTAVVRAIAAYLGVNATNDKVSAIVFEVEKLLHGTPSGIDNTVVAYERPVYFVKGQPPALLDVARPFRLLIGDTGLPSPTRITVGDVRAARQREPERYEQLFRAIGDLASAARGIIEAADPADLGPLMNRNHDRLRELGVSCAELDALAAAARAAGALGAKLSGGGRGGNMIALVTSETEAAVSAALGRAGAKRVIATTIDGGRRTEDGGYL